jgi:hypothetical protein
VTLSARYIIQRVRGEYLEMPGLSLTEQQAQRLWHIDADACRSLFASLVDSGFLRRTSRGGYVRADITSAPPRFRARVPRNT